MRATPAARLLANSEVAPNGCWQWTKGTTDGYGSMSVGGKSMGAHRASYITFVGPIPEGMTIDHTCFNPGCVNPAHLRPLPSDENARTKDPNKTPPWAVVWPRRRGPLRPRSDQKLPPDAPVIDFEESA